MASNDSEDIKPNCLSIDLEVHPGTDQILKLAAVRGDTGESFARATPDEQRLRQALKEMQEFGAGVEFLLGHNLIEFDLPRLRKACPGAAFFTKPVVDTLRVNPLAFPSNPYHSLVKHYKTGALRRFRKNDPELDAREALSLYAAQLRELSGKQGDNPDLLMGWAWLTTRDKAGDGMKAFFNRLRGQSLPSVEEARGAVERFLLPPGAAARACQRQVNVELLTLSSSGWDMAYALAWLSVAGGNSVMPPWVRYQFPGAMAMVNRLRAMPCRDARCDWCREWHDASKALKCWFGFPEFRPEPKDQDGQSLQQNIVEATLRGEHVLGILPTGAGKSICYQLPALSRYHNTGALTVVISPLVALMADQVAGMAGRGIVCGATINGRLTLPERRDVLERIRLGDVGIVIIAPEQLRNRSVQDALAQREIGSWVLDEAHCLAQWGHDFRPDYRYVSRAVKKHAGEGVLPPLLCLTATAKEDVAGEIRDYFRETLGVEMRLIDGGMERPDMQYEVIKVERSGEMERILHILEQHLPEEEPGEEGAIIYCATRPRTENLAQYLREKGRHVEHFHAGLTSEQKEDLQARFIAGECRVITATNAFGMGIDKPDIRLIVHADIPSSIENYLQEAGRAGRDRKGGYCVVLFAPDDVERQFSLSAMNRLTRQDINVVLRSLKRIHRRNNNRHQQQEAIIVTDGEILHEDERGDFARDALTDDTRVRIALSWLEEKEFLRRDENRTRIFPSSLRVASVTEAQKKLRAVEKEHYREQLLRIVETLMDADPDEGISTDEFIIGVDMHPKEVQRALVDLEALGIATDDTALTVFLHVCVERSSLKHQQETMALERDLIELMREEHPDWEAGEAFELHLRRANQVLRDKGHNTALPQRLLQVLKSVDRDGRHKSSGRSSISVRGRGMERVRITLYCSWPELVGRMTKRHHAAGLLLNYLVEQAAGRRGKDILVETTFSKLNQAMKDDLLSGEEAQHIDKFRDHVLLWLHEQEIMRLHSGLAVFRSAMTIYPNPARWHGSFLKEDFLPLEEHYDNQVANIHAMIEYARRGLQSKQGAMQLIRDYFTLAKKAFLDRWCAGKEKAWQRQTTEESWKNIVEDLHSKTQEKIVADDRERTNVLVLAGPGAGKTRVLVHRIAYLVRVRREAPRSILALAYNRHTMLEIRRRLKSLIGNDATRVTVLTCHALAMRLIGASFEEHINSNEKDDEDPFKDILTQAASLLSDDEDGVQRQRALGSFRWILVDEYQDINAEQYELISALVGRRLQEEDARLNLLAVGDDDQNIYAFSGSSVEFIRRFTEDYKVSKPIYLTENYRSTAHIIAAANLVIAPARDRMKSDEHPITIDKRRRKQPPGGAWHDHDKRSRGKVQLLSADADHYTQAMVVMGELRRLKALDPDWDWHRVAIIARQWEFLDPVRNYCELHDIPAQVANDRSTPFFHLRETQSLFDKLRQHKTSYIDAKELDSWLDGQEDNVWWRLLRQGIQEHKEEEGSARLTKDGIIMWARDWGRGMQAQQDALLLTTAHRAKGLEFDHVAVLDGNWGRAGEDEERRLYYVAMTRARHSLILARMNSCRNPFLDALGNSDALLARSVQLPSAIPPELHYRHQQFGMGDVDIGFAGRCDSRHEIHRAIAELKVGDELKMEQKRGKIRDTEGRYDSDVVGAGGASHDAGQEGAIWFLKDLKGRCVGKTAKKFVLPPAKIENVRVRAIAKWSKAQTKADYLSRCRCEQWEVVFPELKYTPRRP